MHFGIMILISEDAIHRYIRDDEENDHYGDGQQRSMIGNTAAKDNQKARVWQETPVHTPASIENMRSILQETHQDSLTIYSNIYDFKKLACQPRLIGGQDRPALPVRSATKAGCEVPKNNMHETKINILFTASPHQPRVPGETLRRRTDVVRFSKSQRGINRAVVLLEEHQHGR